MNFQQLHQQNQIYLPNHKMTVILQQKKGSGAQGAVYQGFIKNQNEQVAIKIITELSERESQILDRVKLKKLKHLIRIDAIENYQNQIIIVMELAEMDFYQFMATDQFKASSVDERNQFFFQMIQGVQEFHSLGYFHRDLKPENFVLCRDQNQNLIIKLIDFGISKVQEEGLQSMKVGTPFYMTREVLNNESYNKSIDVWALGCIWYEILTEKTFIQGNNVISIINNINTIQQGQINFKIDQLITIQNEQKEILKQMICIDKDQRISIDEAILKIFQFFKNKEIETVQAELQQVQEEKKKQLNLELQKKIEELQQQLEQEKENQIQQLQQQLQSEYDQKIEKKEVELKKILQLQQNQYQENREQQILQQTMQYQNDLNQFKTQCELDYKQQLKEKVQYIQIKQRESLEKKQKIENEEVKKKMNEQAKQQYEIELNMKLKLKQLEVDNQQKKAQFQNKRQLYTQVLYFLKDTIQTTLSTMNQQKQIIINLQLENQDKKFMLNLIQKFINDKEQELSQLNQEEESFNSLDEDLQFSKFVELETQYKNQIQIHSQEKSMVDIQIHKFMADSVKKQEQMAREEKQLQEEQQNQQEMNNLNNTYQIFKNQYNESQKQIQQIMKKCENYFSYNKIITNSFQRLKENSNQIASRINQVQQYQSSTTKVTIEQIKLMKFELQEIQNQFQRLQENIISVNESISTYEEELTKQMQFYLRQIQDIEYRIHTQLQDYNLNDKAILIQLQRKQQLMKVFCQKLDNLIKSNIPDTIKEFMEFKQKYEQEKLQVKELSETLSKEQLTMTKIKFISDEQKKFEKELEAKLNYYQQQIEELELQLFPLQQNCKKLQNKDIIQLLNNRCKELNDVKHLAKQKFDDLIQKSKQNLKSQQALNKLIQEGNNIFSELVGKKDEYQKQIIELNRLSDSIFKSESDHKLKEINYALTLLIQHFQTKYISFIQIKLQDYSYDEIVKQYKTKKEQLDEQKRKIESYMESYKENQKKNELVIMDAKKNTSQNSFLKGETNRYISLLEDTFQKSKEKFSKLQEIINEINKYYIKIKFIEVENQQQIQNVWLEKQKQITELNSYIDPFKKKIEGAQNGNQFEIDKLSEQFKNLQAEVNRLSNSIPSNIDINKFQENYYRNNQSFFITFSLIIILKAFNIKRYVVRLKEFSTIQQQKQENKKTQLQKQIQEKKENSESAKIELQKLQYQNITNLEEVKNKEIQAQNRMNKYKSQLQQNEFMIRIEEYTEDETYLDTQITDIQSLTNTPNNVKLKGIIRDQKFNKEFCNQFFDQLEYCRIIGMLKMQIFLTGQKQ